MNDDIFIHQIWEHRASRERFIVMSMFEERVDRHTTRYVEICSINKMSSIQTITEDDLTAEYALTDVQLPSSYEYPSNELSRHLAEVRSRCSKGNILATRRNGERVFFEVVKRGDGSMMELREFFPNNPTMPRTQGFLPLIVIARNFTRVAKSSKTFNANRA